MHLSKVPHTALPVSRIQDARRILHSFVLHVLVAFNKVHCDSESLGQAITGLVSVAGTQSLLAALSPSFTLLSPNL